MRYPHLYAAQVSPLEANSTRETIICGIEARARSLRKEGACDAWLQYSDPLIGKLSIGVNGPLLYELAAMADHNDKECIEFFRKGAFVVYVFSSVPHRCSAFWLNRLAIVWHATEFWLREG